MRAFGYAACNWATQPERMVSLTMLSPRASSRSSPPSVRMRRVRVSRVQSAGGGVNCPAGMSFWIAAIWASERQGVLKMK